MHYYPHNIKQFNNATRHLTRVERSLYRDAIELYYDSEEPLQADIKVLSRRLMASTDEEKEALLYVLGEFFYLDGDVYRQDRCDEEIDKYHSNTSAKAMAGKASAKARRLKKEAKDEQNLTGVKQVLNGCLTERQQNSTNQEPRTINQQPLLKDIVQPSVERVKEPDFITPAFNYFWDRYPRKTGKKKSFLKFKVLMKNKKEDGVRELTNKIAYDINFKIKSEAWNPIEKPEFIPHPLTYLNSEGWLDHE